MGKPKKRSLSIKAPKTEEEIEELKEVVPASSSSSEDEAFPSVGTQINDRLAFKLEEMPHGMAVADSQQRVLYVDRGFEVMTGMSGQQAAGQRLGELEFLRGGGKGEGVRNNPLQQALDAEKSWQGRLLCQDAGGSPYWAVIGLEAIKDVRGDTTQFILTQTDVSKKAGKVDKLKEKGERMSDSDDDDDDSEDEEEEEEKGDEEGRPRGWSKKQQRMLEKEEQDLRSRLKRMGKLKESKISLHKPSTSTTLEFRNLNYIIEYPIPPKGIWPIIKNKIPFMPKPTAKRQILFDLNGIIRPGELLAIMGPTGSGKTTLLNILAGRTKKNVTGQILINGKKPKKNIKRQTAYVLQDDVFFPNLTVRETLTYTALVKLPRSLTWKQKKQRVEEVISELSIEKCANTIIGGPFQRGVSGGERKRTNIGNELLMNPSLVLLDEPTSGLDSSTALSLVYTMKALAQSGRTVITTIHQPSSAMYGMFDNVLLLADGHIVYYGPAKDAVAYFSRLGYSCSPFYNPADFLLEVLTTEEKTNDGKPVKQLLIEHYKEEEEEHNSLLQNNSKEPEFELSRDKTYEKHKFPTSFWTQTWVLAQRNFKQQKGEVFNKLNVLQVLAMTFIMSIFWFQMDYKEDAISERFGFIFFASVFWTFMSLFQALYSFPPERKVLNKERASGSYRLSAYFVAKSISETPLHFVYPSAFIVIAYWMVNLNRESPERFFFAWLLILLIVVTGTSLGLLITTVWVDVKEALVIASVSILGLMLLGGFYISPENMPVWIRWARWISFIKYYYEALTINDMDDGAIEFDPSPVSSYNTTQPIPGSRVLEEEGVETEAWWDVLVILGLIVVARLLTYFSLRFLNRPKK
ncbi:Broad substrate specificity ATP-binding cassette transporter ABCG2 [Balamuthia mandrillaris]